jgi:hypothetical protein
LPNKRTNHELKGFPQTDLAFGVRRFDACLAKCCAELDEKREAAGGDPWDAIRRYNASGSGGERNVQAFTGYCATVTGIEPDGQRPQGRKDWEERSATGPGF